MKIEHQARAWLDMLNELGIKLPRAAAWQARCPECGNGTLRFYIDTVMGGKRFHSDCCLGDGDLLDLIAKRRASSRAEALIWLEGQLPDLFLTYANPSSLAAELNVRRKKIEDLWGVAKPLPEARFATELLRIGDSRGLPIRQVTVGNDNSLFEQFRIVTAEQLQAVSDDSLMAAKRRFVVKDSAKESPAYLVARLYTLPGQISGMSFFTVGRNNEHIDFHWSIGDRAHADAGYLIHPRCVGGSKPVVLMTSPRCALYAIFHAASQDKDPTSIACLIDETDLCTRSIQPLVGRSVIAWCGQLTPRLLNFAARLDSSVSHYHFSKGKLHFPNGAGFTMLDFERRLAERSRSWDDALFEQGDRSNAVGALYELILAANLDRQTVERLANKFAPAHTAMLVEQFVRPLSNQFITTSMGSVEQRAYGWVTLRKGKELLIANKCWRVANITYEQRAAQVSLEILDSGAWHPCNVDYQELVAAPFRVVADACSRLGLSPFTFDRKWQTRALHIALQFHPCVDVLKHIPLGLEGDRVRTTRTEISVADGGLQPIAGVSKHTLLPLAGRELPSAKSIASLCSNTPWVRAVTALVQQLARHFLGQRELLVVGGGQYARVASQVLHACGFQESTCLPVLRTVDLTQCCDAKRAKRELLGEDALWGNTDHDTAHWLAGMRPTIYLGNKCKPEERFLNNNQIQSIVLHLLARTLSQLHAGIPCSIAAEEAWCSLLKACHVEVAPPHGIPAVKVTHAIGYWISRGITSGKLQTTAKKPRAVKKSSIWPDRNPNYFWVHQASINYVLDSYSFPSWNIAELHASVEQSGSFGGAERLGRAMAWKFVRGILTNEAQFALSNLGSVEANPPPQSSVAPATEQFVSVSAKQPAVETEYHRLLNQNEYTTIAIPTEVSGVTELHDLPPMRQNISAEDLLVAARSASSEQLAKV